MAGEDILSIAGVPTLAPRGRVGVTLAHELKVEEGAGGGDDAVWLGVI